MNVCCCNNWLKVKWNMVILSISFMTFYIKVSEKINDDNFRSFPIVICTDNGTKWFMYTMILTTDNNDTLLTVWAAESGKSTNVLTTFFLNIRYIFFGFFCYIKWLYRWNLQMAWELIIQRSIIIKKAILGIFYLYPIIRKVGN